MNKSDNTGPSQGLPQIGLACKKAAIHSSGALHYPKSTTGQIQSRLIGQGKTIHRSQALMRDVLVPYQFIVSNIIEW